MARHTALLLSLVAALACCASAQLPDSFSNPGGPAFLDGTWQTWNATGADITTFTSSDGVAWVLKGKFGGTRLTPGGAISESGTYASWQCGPVNGSYVALIDITTTAADGTVGTPVRLCEFGIYDPFGFINSWARSDGACPTEAANTSQQLSAPPSDVAIDYQDPECGYPEDSMLLPDAGDAGDWGDMGLPPAPAPGAA